jgi:hypothetical protein
MPLELEKLCLGPKVVVSLPPNHGQGPKAIVSLP